ncbi:MAG TPA: patatin-like phospholipase family protein [Clostridia bacterium]|nr:patatin-like phospholipase family protein [Clostridia bacterium]
MSFGLVLSGGGLRGAVHIGILQALEEINLKPAFIAGTSAGSLVAGLYAYGYSPQEIKYLAKKINKDLFDLNYWGIISSLCKVFKGKKPTNSGLILGKRLEKYFFELTRGIKLNELKLSLAITAVDINNSEIIVFTSSDRRLLRRPDYHFFSDVTLAAAMRASISLPGIFCPKIIKKRCLVDGGIRAYLPVEITRLLGAKKVIAVNLGYGGEPVPNVQNFWEITLQALDLMIYQITQPSMYSADLLISPQVNIGPINLGAMESLINCGYQALLKSLPQIKGLFGD